MTPWIVAHQAPLSMRFSRQEYWSGLPFPSPGDLSDPGMEPRSPPSRVDSLPSEPPGKAFLGVVEIKRPDRRKNQVYAHTKAKGKAENLGVLAPGISTQQMFNAYNTGREAWCVRASWGRHVCFPFRTTRTGESRLRGRAAASSKVRVGTSEAGRHWPALSVCPHLNA